MLLFSAMPQILKRHFTVLSRKYIGTAPFITLFSYTLLNPNCLTKALIKVLLQNDIHVQ